MGTSVLPGALDEGVETVALAEVSGAAAPLAPGTRLGRYSVLQLLGRGGMGEVYKAYDPDLDRAVAIKLVRAQAGAPEELLAEARALARVSHPNIVPIFDVGACDGGVFLTMELLDGETLRSFQKRHRGDTSRLLRVYVAAGHGLAAAHRAGVLHRDFKPENVLVGRDGRVHVLDFGLATGAAPPDPTKALAGSGASSLATLSGGSATLSASSSAALPSVSSSGSTPAQAAGLRRAGTPRYMAREQHLGLPVDARADQFAFAVALFEALYGAHPYGEGAREIQKNVELGQGPRRLDPPAGVGARVRDALQRALAPASEARFPTMDALLERIAPREARASARRAVGLGLALAGVAIAVGLAVRSQRAGALCGGGDERVRAVWGPGVAERIADVFHRTGLPYADDSAARVRAALDGHAERWLASYVQTCEATRLRGTQSEELLDLRMACLDHRLVELATVVRVLEQGTPSAVERAVLVTQELSPPQQCAAVERNAGGAPRPRAGAEAAALAEAERADAEWHALFAAGDFKGADQAAARQLAAATRSTFEPAIAQAHHNLGRTASELGRYKEAETELHAAGVAALRGRDPAVFAHSRIDVIFTVGDRLGRTEEGLRAAAEAEAAAQAAMDTSPRAQELLGYASSARGNVLMRAGRYDEAERSARAGYDLLQRIRGPEHPQTLNALQVLGNVAFLSGRYAEAASLLGSVATTRSKLLGAEHPQVAVSDLNWANALSEGGHHDEALALYERALRTITASYGQGHMLVGTALTNMGDELRILGRYEEALACQHRALAAIRASLGDEHREIAVALHNLASTELAAGRPAAALAPAEEALAMRRRVLGDAHPFVREDQKLLTEIRGALARR